ncbi:MAG: AMP-binding protein, partial [Gammaproteobacteria bacterium]|nr:AMP-binding protein [Gammaproteobacteria bacterium]
MEMSDNTLLWQPTDEQKQSSAMWDFARKTQAFHGGAADDFDALHAWSVNSPAKFYNTLWDYLEIVGDKGEQAYMAGETIHDAQFYPGARLNYAENLLQNADDRLAVIAHRDDGTRRTITREALYQQVSRTVQALKAEGVSEGDRVAAIVSHDIEAIIGYLATSAIGAIWSSCSPDFGPAGASDRLCQIEPTILLALPNYHYAGKYVAVSPTIEAVATASQLTQVVLIRYAIPDRLAAYP